LEEKSLVVESELSTVERVNVLGETTLFDVSIHTPKTHNAMKTNVVKVDV
jgi:hypothetical protein